jgi:hypothetical protein
MNDMRSSDEDLFIADAKRALDDSVHQLDRGLAGRLQRARREALDTSLCHRRWWRWAGGIAIASIGLLAIVFLIRQPDLDSHAMPMLEDLELMTSIENVELSEDLEFYDWLADSPTAG